MEALEDSEEEQNQKFEPIQAHGFDKGGAKMTRMTLNLGAQFLIVIGSSSFSYFCTFFDADNAYPLGSQSGRC